MFFSVIKIIIIFINFFVQVFFQYTEAVTTTLISTDAILPEICDLIICFSCTVWTKNEVLAGSLADCVLADAILIATCPPIPPTN